MTQDVTQAILDVIEALEGSANEADPSKAEAVLWLDDERFSEIEDFIPEPFGAGVVRDVHNWIRENGKPGDNVRLSEPGSTPSRRTWPMRRPFKR